MDSQLTRHPAMSSTWSTIASCWSEDLRDVFGVVLRDDDEQDARPLQPQADPLELDVGPAREILPERDAADAVLPDDTAPERAITVEGEHLGCRPHAAVHGRGDRPADRIQHLRRVGLPIEHPLGHIEPCTGSNGALDGVEIDERAALGITHHAGHDVEHASVESAEPNRRPGIEEIRRRVLRQRRKGHRALDAMPRRYVGNGERELFGATGDPEGSFVVAQLETFEVGGEHVFDPPQNGHVIGSRAERRCRIERGLEDLVDRGKLDDRRHEAVRDESHAEVRLEWLCREAGGDTDPRPRRRRRDIVHSRCPHSSNLERRCHADAATPGIASGTIRRPHPSSAALPGQSRCWSSA